MSSMHGYFEIESLYSTRNSSKMKVEELLKRGISNLTGDEKSLLVLVVNQYLRSNSKIRVMEEVGIRTDSYSDYSISLMLYGTTNERIELLRKISSVYYGIIYECMAVDVQAAVISLCGDKEFDLLCSDIVYMGFPWY